MTPHKKYKAIKLIFPKGETQTILAENIDDIELTSITQSKKKLPETNTIITMTQVRRLDLKLYLVESNYSIFDSLTDTPNFNGVVNGGLKAIIIVYTDDTKEMIYTPYDIDKDGRNKYQRHRWINEKDKTPIYHFTVED